MRLRHPAILAILIASWPATAATPPSVAKTFGGWTAVCNNLGACTVLGSSQGELLAYLLLTRDAGATAAPEVAIVVASQTPIKGDVGSLRLTANAETAKTKTAKTKTTTPLGPYRARAQGHDAGTFRATITSGEPVLAMIAALRDAKTLDVAIGRDRALIDLKGLSAALRYVDANQGRAGTPTALVARGMTPIGQVTPGREPPVVTAAPAGSVTAIAKPILTPALLAAATPACDPDVVEAHDGAQAWRVGVTRLLVAVPCTQGAYNFGSALFFETSDGGDPVAVALPRPLPLTDDTAANVVVNMEFDAQTLSLQSFDKGRGVGDCGTTTTWLWTGSAFALLDATTLTACPGALPKDWPNAYTAVRAK